MFGSSPCYPGFDNESRYANVHFYCSACDGIVQPKAVNIALIDPEGSLAGSISVLRCKNHALRGFHVTSPITTLWGLSPVNDSVNHIRERMMRICFCIQNLDVLSVLSALGSIISLIAAAILGFVITTPMIVGLSHWILPAVILGVGVGLLIVSVFSAWFSRSYFKEWLILSRDYIKHCELVCVQAGTDRYAMLTGQPPTCSQI